MSLLKCGFCGKRCISGVHYVYWFAPSRVADVFRVRQRLCDDHLHLNVYALLTPESAETLTCSACGISVDDDVFPIYVTIWGKEKEPERGAMALCEEHQQELKVRAAMGATILEDRDAPSIEHIERESHVAAREVYTAMGRKDPRAGYGRPQIDGGKVYVAPPLPLDPA
jgi:hypothetical protein